MFKGPKITPRACIRLSVIYTYCSREFDPEREFVFYDPERAVMLYSTSNVLQTCEQCLKVARMHGVGR